MATSTSTRRETACRILDEKWKNPMNFLPPRWSSQEIPLNDFPDILVINLAEVAMIAPGKQMRIRFHQVLDMEFDEVYLSQRDPVPTSHDALRALSRLVESVKLRVNELWPKENSYGLTGTKFFPHPHAVEQFGSWPQQTVEFQVFADGLTLESYQNSLNDTGAAFGITSMGPTLAIKLIAGRTRDWRHDSRDRGRVWRVPDNIRKTGYGNIQTMNAKRDCMIQLEYHFRVPLAGIIDMEELRPEDAYFFSLKVLQELCKIITHFPSVALQDFCRRLRKAWKTTRTDSKNSGGRVYYNLSAKTCDNLFRILAEDFPPQKLISGSEDSTSQASGNPSRDATPDPDLLVSSSTDVPLTRDGRSKELTGVAQSASGVNSTKKQTGSAKIKNLEQQLLQHNKAHKVNLEKQKVAREDMERIETETKQTEKKEKKLQSRLTKVGQHAKKLEWEMEEAQSQVKRLREEEARTEERRKMLKQEIGDSKRKREQLERDKTQKARELEALGQRDERGHEGSENEN